MYDEDEYDDQRKRNNGVDDIILIPQDRWGNLMVGIKEDEESSFVSGPKMKPQRNTFKVGDMVKIDLFWGTGGIYKSPGVFWRLPDRYGRIGTVVAREGDLYFVSFDDGDPIGFYHNELEPHDA